MLVLYNMEVSFNLEVPSSNLELNVLRHRTNPITILEFNLEITSL